MHKLNLRIDGGGRLSKTQSKGLYRAMFPNLLDTCIYCSKACKF